MKNFYISPVCRLQFLYMLYNRTWAYIIFSVGKDEGITYVNLQQCGRKTNTHEKFLESLSPTEPKWILYDFPYTVD